MGAGVRRIGGRHLTTIVLLCACVQGIAAGAANGQARSRSFASELGTIPMLDDGSRGVRPPGVSAGETSRGLIRKAPIADTGPEPIGGLPRVAPVVPPAPAARSVPTERAPPSPGQPVAPGPIHTYQLIEKVPEIGKPPAAGGPPKAEQKIKIRPTTIMLVRDEGGRVVDTRQKVTLQDLRQMPNSAIGQITVRYPSGVVQIGTGFLVTASVVLTAAHVLVSPDHGRAGTVEFAPGCRDAAETTPSRLKAQSVGANRYRVTDAWARGETALSEDYGAIFLPDAQAFADCGTFVVPPVEDSFTNRYATSGRAGFMVAGYPAEKLPGSQWLGKGALLHSPPSVLKHVIDTTRGQSGAPLFAMIRDQASGKILPTAIGIHSRPAEASLNHNEARRIDRRVLEDVRRWLAEFER